VKSDKHFAAMILSATKIGERLAKMQNRFYLIAMMNPDSRGEPVQHNDTSVIRGPAIKKAGRGSAL